MLIKKACIGDLQAQFFTGDLRVNDASGKSCSGPGIDLDCNNFMYILVDKHLSNIFVACVHDSMPIACMHALRCYKTLSSNRGKFNLSLRCILAY